MPTRVRVAGRIVPNDYAWYYRDWLQEECTCPDDIAKAIAEANGETLVVEINSIGGEIASGSDIYTALRNYRNVEIEITGQACSAASVIAMAGHSRMSPTALMMIHGVSTSCAGDHQVMEHIAETLRQANEALSTSYMLKSGKSRAEVLEMMDHETWITAEQAVAHGLVDEVMTFDTNDSGASIMVAGELFELPTDSQMEAARLAVAKTLADEDKAADDEVKQARLRANFLRLKGVDIYDQV